MSTATYQPKTKDHEHPLEKAKEAGAQALDKAKEAVGQPLERAKEAGAEAIGKAKEAAKEAVGAVGDMAGQAASAVGHKADDWTAAAGHQAVALGETIEKKGPHQGIAGQATHAVADAIKGGGKYVEDAKLSGMADDVGQLIKNHPVPTILVALGIGFCIGRAMKD